MGSKGSQTSQTNQTQTYNPAGASYLQNALQQGQNAASLPFNIPQAPVAGFSGQQQQAFNQTGAAQGIQSRICNRRPDISARKAQASFSIRWLMPLLPNCRTSLVSRTNRTMQTLFNRPAASAPIALP